MTRKRGGPPDPLADAPEELRRLDFWARAGTARATPGDCAGFYAYSVRHAFVGDRARWLRQRSYSNQEAHQYARRGVPDIREIVTAAGLGALNAPLYVGTVPAPDEPSYRPPRDPQWWPAP